MVKKKHNDPNLGILEAIRLSGTPEKEGDQYTFAAAMNISQPSVVHWLYVTCPPRRAVEIEQKFGVPAEKIRPDIFKR